MLISDAQGDVRRVYEGGFYGQLVSGAVWLAGAALGTWVSTAAGIASLMVGGALIVPLTTLVLKAAGRDVALPSGHPMAPLATQIAFTVPIGLVVALGATVHRTDWSFPAALLIEGAHYLPFVFLYGMPVVRRYGGHDDLRRCRVGAVDRGAVRHWRLAGGGSAGRVRVPAARRPSPNCPLNDRHHAGPMTCLPEPGALVG